MGLIDELELNKKARIFDQARKWEDIMRANKAQLLISGIEFNCVAKVFTDEKGQLDVFGAFTTIYMAAYVDGVEQIPAYDEECPEHYDWSKEECPE